MLCRISSCRTISFEKKTEAVYFLLRWGWVFLERTRILSGINFTTHFIEIFVVQKKRFVGRFVNVILTRQTAASARAGLRKANAER